MATRRTSLARGDYGGDPFISIYVWPMVARTHCVVHVDHALLGGTSRVPTGSMGLRLAAGDLVGRSPASATLKVLHHLVRTLEHIVSTQELAAGPGAPGGGHGGGTEGQLELDLTL